ncbi:MAG: hypothetical protein ACOY8P_06170 [Thermodesulfobacteriota bacterium]|jgi:hypothetical protein
MHSTRFEIRPDPELWASLDMDVARFDKARQMPGEAYRNSCLAQRNRPAGSASALRRECLTRTI